MIRSLAKLNLCTRSSTSLSLPASRVGAPRNAHRKLGRGLPDLSRVDSAYLSCQGPPAPGGPALGLGT